MFNNKQVKNENTAIAKAIEALNDLTKHFQEHSNPITIKLTVPWEKHRNMGAKGAGKDENGLLGVIDFSAPSETNFMEHPFIKALQSVNLFFFSRSHSTIGTIFRCTIVLHTLDLIEQLPNNCQALIEEDLNQRQGISCS